MNYDKKIGKAICAKISQMCCEGIFKGWKDPEECENETVKVLNAMLAF